MSNFSNSFSRRKFIITAGASAMGSVFLKGCLGNPPEPTAQGGDATGATLVVATPNEKRVEGLETTKITLGIYPLLSQRPWLLRKKKASLRSME